MNDNRKRILDAVSYFAVLDVDRTYIDAVYACDDSLRDRLVARYGRRCVYLPMGGHVGDRVRVSEDGEAMVVRSGAHDDA